MLFRTKFGSFVTVTNGTACMGESDLRLMRGMCMIGILEVFCGFLMTPRSIRLRAPRPAVSSRSAVNHLSASEH